MNNKIMLMGAMLITLLIGVGLYMRTGVLGGKRTTDTLVIGTAAGYAPFVSINERGDYEGFDIDVAKAVAKQMGKKLELKDLGSMAPLLTALEQGSIDAIIWGMSITQERLKKVAMVHYQGAATLAYPLIFWQKIPVGVHSLSDMAGKTVCVEPAAAQDTVLSRYPQVNKLPTEKVDDALLNIQYGKADAALVEPAIARKFSKKYPEIKTLDVPLVLEDQVQGVGIMLQKNNVELGKALQEAVEYLRSTGVITALEAKWGIV